MNYVKVETESYFKALIIISTIASFTLFLYTPIVPLSFCAIFCIAFVVSCIYSFYNLQRVILFRLFLDNILLFYMTFAGFDLIFTIWFFYGFFIQTLICLVINLMRYHNKRSVCFYFITILFIFPLIHIFVDKFMFYSGILTGLLILAVSLIFKRLFDELKQKNKKILELQKEQTAKSKRIVELMEQLRRHEINNLLVRISFYIEAFCGPDETLSENILLDIKRISDMFQKIEDTELFVIISQIEKILKKRYKDVTILSYGETQKKISSIIAQSLFIFIENACEANAKNIKINKDKDSIMIQDDGIGFNKDRIRYNRSTKGKQGIGLQTVLNILEAQGCSTKIESIINKGTIIAISNI